MRKKIVLIGAGSAMFTQGLISDLIVDSRETSWCLALVDIDEKALDMVAKLCKKMIEAREADIEIQYSTDRREVLSGADYVVATVGVGGRRAWEQDVFIPRKYGIFQPVGDSVMPGGISRAMRMIPAMIDITEDIIKLCPEAHFFNYSNPMTFICRAVRKATGFPVVGLCHGVINTQRMLAEFAGLDKHSITSLAVGINHLTFMYDFREKGRDAWPMLRKNLDKLKEKNPFSCEFFEKYGVYPAPGDRHITEYFAERFPGGKYYGKILGKDAFSFEDTIESGDKAYEEMVESAYSPQTLTEEFFQKFDGEQEQLLDIIRSIEQDKRIIFSANLPNEGAVSNLPDYAVLEMPSIAASKGLMPLHTSGLPCVLAGFINRHLSIAEIVIEAALKGDKKLFEEAVLLGGYLTDKNAVKSMVDDMLNAQSKYLPQF